MSSASWGSIERIIIGKTFILSTLHEKVFDQTKGRQTIGIDDKGRVLHLFQRTATKSAVKKKDLQGVSVCDQLQWSQHMMCVTCVIPPTREKKKVVGAKPPWTRGDGHLIA